MTLNWAGFFKALNLNTVSARRRKLTLKQKIDAFPVASIIFSRIPYINFFKLAELKLKFESIKPCRRRLNLQQSTLMYWMSSMSCTSTLSSEQTVNSCNLQRTKKKKKNHRDQVH